MTTTRNEAAEVNSSRTQGQPSPWEDILGHLSQPDQLADIIIDVEGHQLYTSKYMLASVSSKFRQIFTDTAAESPNILPLPGVSLQAAVDLLRWLLPLETLTISAENIDSILKIATDYDIKKLVEKCEHFFLEKLKPSTCDEDFVEYISLSQRYGLSAAKEMAINHLAHLPMDELESLDTATGVAVSTMSDILKRRLKMFESRSLTSGNVAVASNVILVVDDKEIVASSAALSVASDVFRTMIKSNFDERKTGKIVMPGKSYEAVKFMVDFVSSQDHLPISGEYIEECVGLADEYMLGRLKHACSDYMISNATSLQLNDCLFYLFLAHKYRLSDVEEKIISLNRQRSTADILRCSNYDVTAVGPLILKHTQWLEEEMTSLKSGINRFKKWVSKSISDIINSLQTAMTDPVQPVRCKEGHTITGQGHNDIPFSKISKTFVNNCHGCALLIISQLKSELDYINNYRPFSRGLTKKSFLDQLDIKFAELSGL